MNASLGNSSSVLTQVVPVHTGATKELDNRNVRTLQGFLERDYTEEIGGTPHHGHGEKPTSIVTAVAAAVINYFLMFGLCCAYGMIVFADDHHKQHRALGVKMSLASAFIMGSLLAGLSRVPVAIGGTDLNPVVFLGDFVTTMAPEIAGSLGLSYPQSDYRRLEGSGGGGVLQRFLASPGSSEFCVGSHLESHRAACEEYQEQIRATTIFAVAVSSALLGLVYFCLGRFRLTRYVNYLPTSITEAFLSCIGYKVFKYALKFCNYNIQIFVPAACIGVPMYFLKAMHIGNPAIVMPACLLVPLGVFYAFLYGTGSDITEARNQNLMFPEMYNVPFYAIWTDCLGKTDRINVRAWAATLPDLGLMVIVCILDCVLKISATENKLPVKVQTDYEIMLHGAGNALVVACGSPVGYMQLKFNVISYGVMNNVRDRRAGWMYAGLCGISLISTIGHFNYLPRFFMGTMLFFAGAGFVAENLWGSRKYLSFLEWGEILLILGVFIITGQLLPAVGVGIILCGISFIMKYARVPAIAGRPMTGRDVSTRERPKSLLVQKNLQYIAASWLMVVRLKGFVFFASAHAVCSFVRNRLDSEEAEQLPRYRRLKYVIFDCELLDGMDASGAKALLKLVKDCHAVGVKVFWSSMTMEFTQELRTRSIISKDGDWFVDLNQAVRYVETQVLRYRMAQQEKWLQLHVAFQRTEEFMLKRIAFEPFRHIFLMESARVGCPWRYCSSMPILKYRTVLYEPGQTSGTLFLVHSGAVALFDAIPSGQEGDDWTAPTAVYQHGWFLNREALLRAPSKNYAIATEDGEVLCWTQDQWWQMTCDHPLMMLELLKAAMKQQGRDNERDSQAADHMPCNEMDDEEWLEFEAEGFTETFLVRATTWSRPASMVHRSRDSSFSSTPRAGLRRLRSSTKSLDHLALDHRHRRRSEREAVAASVSVASVGSSAISELYAQDRRTSCDGSSDGRPSSVLESVLSDNPRASIGGLQGRAILNLPEELQVCLRELQLAAALGRMNFYEPPALDEELFLPKLPKPCLLDLEIAFNTFSVLRQGARVVEPDQVTSALMYAGFFNRIVEEPRRALDKANFLEFGRQALLMKLGENQREVIATNFFKHAQEKGGLVKPSNLTALFRSFLRIDICMNEVDSISRTWLADPNGQFDVQAFESIVSWFLRKHEHDWHLMCGFRDVMEATPDRRVTEAKLSADLLAKKAGIALSEAEEMMWSADWLNGQGGGMTLDFGGLMSVVLMCLRSQHSRLPPSPRLSDQEVSAGGRRCSETYELNDHQAEICGQEVQMISCQTEAYLSTTQKAWTCPRLSQQMEPEVPLTFHERLAILLDDPRSSTGAAILSAFISCMIILSVIHMVLEPLLSGDESVQSEQEKEIWFGTELFFTILFTAEFLARLLVVLALHTSTLLEFILTPRNICDFVAIIPLYVEIILRSADFEALTLLRIVRLARLSRLARIARLSRRFPLAAPISVVLVVIWGIYLLNTI